MCETREGRAWLILDARLVGLALHECLRGKLWAFQSVPAALLMLLGCKRARSLAGLAKRIDIDPAVLQYTIDTYNTTALDGRDSAFGKSAAMLQPLMRSPYYAIDISSDSRVFPCPSITLGGLHVDETSNAVLSATGAPVEGLCRGRAACGLASNHYVSGLSLADCIWSGRQAGRAAAGAVLANCAHSLTETD